RTLDTSARPPESRCSPVTTMVLPAPVSPVTTVKPACSSSRASSMTPRPWMRISASTPHTVAAPTDETRARPHPTRRYVRITRRLDRSVGVTRMALAPALHRERELLHQAVGERAVPQPDQPHRRATAGDAHARARRQVDVPGPVAGQHGR